MAELNTTPNKELPSVKKNYFYNLAYQILTLITPFITAPYTARTFGADGIGVQSYTASVTSYFVLFAVLGLSSYGQREIAQNRDDRLESSKIFWEIEILSVVITFVVLIAWGVFVFCFSTAEFRPFYLIQTITILSVAFDISWFYSGHEQFRLIVIRNFFVRVIGIVCLFVFIKKREDLLLYIAILSIVGLVGNLSMWISLPKFVARNSIKRLKPFRHLNQTLLYFIPTIATSVYTVLDKTMIGLITKDTLQNGYYEQATKIVKIGLAAVTSLNTVMGSRMSYLFALKKYDEIKSKLNSSMSFSLLITIPMGLGLCGVAKTFVPWFFGHGYEEVIPLIYVYSFILIPIGISNCLGSQYLTPSGQRTRSSKGIIAGAVINATLNAIAIPFWGAKGAAVASVIAEGAIAVIYVYMSKSYMNFLTVLKLSWKRIIASAVMFCVVIAVGWGLQNKVMGIFVTLIQICVGVIIYALLLFVLRDSFVSNFLLTVKNKFFAKKSEE